MTGSRFETIALGIAAAALFVGLASTLPGAANAIASALWLGF